MLILALVLVPAGRVLAQESGFAAAMKTNLVEPVTPSTFVHTTEFREREHRFWDRDNGILFAAVGASAAADFWVTRSNLAHGGRELNPVAGMFAGSTAGLAINFAGETAGSIGLSYLFHKTGHHKLERAVCLINIGSSATAVSFDLAHR
jgi:hypothetical protein